MKDEIYAILITQLPHCKRSSESINYECYSLHARKKIEKEMLFRSIFCNVQSYSDSKNAWRQLHDEDFFKFWLNK